MKTILVVFAVGFAANLAASSPTSQPGKIPEYLREFVCRASDDQYEKCIWNAFEKSRPFFIKGIPELDMPAVDPFELPLMTVNRTINDLISIQAICKNIRVLGGGNTIIKSLKADPKTGTGKIRLTIPWNYMEMEYDVTGQLLAIPLASKGFFSGNFSDIQVYVKGSVKRYKRDEVEYFKVNKLTTKITVGDGHISLRSKDPDMQFAADLISTFYNENPRRVMDAVNPIFIESSNELFRVVADQILSKVPADEWVPA